MPAIGLLMGLVVCPCLFAGKEYLAGPGEKTVPDELLVGLQPGADINWILGSVAPRGRARIVSRARNTYLLHLPSGMQASASKLLAAHPLVDYVEPNRIRQIAVTTPNDPLLSQQWALNAIQGIRAWSYFPDQYLTSATASTTRVKVAILDTGVDCTHPDFMNAGGTSTDSAQGGQLAWSSSQALLPTTIPSPVCPWQDDNGHGTLAAGAIAAATNNGAGVASLGFPLQLLVFKVIDSSGQSPDNIVAEGIAAAVSAGAQVVSMSLAGAGYSQTLQTEIDAAWQHNVLVVAAAGNNLGSTLTFPGDANHVLTVAATDTNNQVAGFSNFGPWVKIAAPGVNIESTAPTYANASGSTNYGLSSGTSMATSFVSALAGLLFAANPNISAAAVAERIQQSAQTPNTGWDQYIGCGVINAAAALAGTPGSATLGNFTGQVVDSSNNPIPGAVVSAGGQSFTTLVDPKTGTSTGLFRLANLFVGTYSITVSAPGHSSVTIQSVVVPGADTILEIPMGITLGQVTGTVSHSGVAIAGAVVEALSGNPPLVLGTTLTHSAGGYNLYLPANTYTFLGSAPNYVNTSSSSRTVGTVAVTANLSLPALGYLTGTVSDVNGVAVSGAHINFVSSSFSGGAFTGANGGYSTFGIPNGTYTVTASAPGFTNVSTSNVGVATDVATLANFRFSTAVACAVAGAQATSVSDVQKMVNEALGVLSGANDLNGDGVVNVVDVQVVINFALGLGCIF